MPELTTEPGTLWRLASVLGLLCLVVAYLLNQRGLWRPDTSRYLLTNVVGSGLLAAYSWVIGEWVFVGLEGFWCVASLQALARAREGAPPAPPPAAGPPGGAP